MKLSNSYRVLKEEQSEPPLSEWEKELLLDIGRDKKNVGKPIRWRMNQAAAFLNTSRQNLNNWCDKNLIKCEYLGEDAEVVLVEEGVEYKAKPLRIIIASLEEMREMKSIVNQ